MPLQLLKNGDDLRPQLPQLAAPVQRRGLGQRL